MSLKKRLVIALIAVVLWFVILGAGYCYQVVRCLGHYRAAQASEARYPPLVPIMEGDRLIAFREQVRDKDWQTFGISEQPLDDVLIYLGYSPDVAGMTQFLSASLPPFAYLNLRAMTLPIVAITNREEEYFQADDGHFHINADASVGLIFLSDAASPYEVVHYFHNTDEGLMMGALMRLPEKKRNEVAAYLDIIPKPEI